MTPGDLAEAPATEIAATVRSGKVEARALFEATVARIEAANPAINAFTSLTLDRGRDEADRVDRAVAAGRDPGPLSGVPYGVKNLYDVAGEVTLAGSRINADNPPAAHDATLVARLGAAGAVLVGLTNMDEYAYGFTTENSHYGHTRNPHDPLRSAGGSSGGSGAAVAAGLVPFALGSDTNGSIRVPASLCGSFGFKPTYGRLSRAGVFPFASSLDHAGPLARSAADLAAVYDAVSGPDPRDPVCRSDQAPGPPLSSCLEQGANGLRIAVAGGYFEQGCDDQALAVVRKAAEALGAEIRVEIPEAVRAQAAAAVITTVEGATIHLDNLRRRRTDFEPLIRDRLVAGAVTPAVWYDAAQRFRRWYRDQVAALFRDWDILLAPATPCPAQPLGQETMELGGEEVLLRPSLGRFTRPLTPLGLPIVTAPVPQPGCLPLGLQIIAAPWREADALRVAAALERSGVARAELAEITNPGARDGD